MGAHLQYRIVKPSLLSVFFVTEGFGGVVVVEVLVCRQPPRQSLFQTCQCNNVQPAQSSPVRKYVSVQNRNNRN